MPPHLSVALMLAAILWTNIYITASAAASDPVVTVTRTSSSCTRPLHTVYVYTSDSSTYVVQDLGSASLCSSTRSLAALASDSTSAFLDDPTQTNAASPASADAFSRSNTLWCAPTTVTAPGSCQNLTSIGEGSISERTITSYVYGNNSSILRTITTQIPAITSYVYRSGSQECGTSIYERTITSYVAGSESGNISCPSVPMDSPSCPAPVSNGAELSVRTIVSQPPAMTSYVYRSGSDITITVTNEPAGDADSSAVATGASNPSGLYAGESWQRTITSFVYVSANISCPSPSALQDQTFTSYIYGANTTITIETPGSACQPSQETSGTRPSESGSSTVPSLEAAPTSISSGAFVITTTAAGVTQTTTAGGAYFTQTLTEGSIVQTTTIAFIGSSTEDDAPQASGDELPTGADGSSFVAPSETYVFEQPTPSPVTANATSLQQQGVSSDPYVIAEVVNSESNPPLQGTGGNDFLLVTFGTTESQSSAAAPGKRGIDKRQAPQPLVYNTTQYFSSVGGGIYNLSAYAANAQNGNTPPNCALTICAGGQCGPAQRIDSSFRSYSYIYNAQSTSSSDIGTFSIQCVGPAYVGLDNVAVTAIYLPPATPSPGQTRYVVGADT